VTEDAALLRRYRDMGVARVVISVPAAGPDEILPLLDRWAKLMRQIGG